jgi:hypothetical protein
MVELVTERLAVPVIAFHYPLGCDGGFVWALIDAEGRGGATLITNNVWTTQAPTTTRRLRPSLDQIIALHQSLIASVT